MILRNKRKYLFCKKCGKTSSIAGTKKLICQIAKREGWEVKLSRGIFLCPECK